MNSSDADTENSTASQENMGTGPNVMDGFLHFMSMNQELFRPSLDADPLLRALSSWSPDSMEMLALQREWVERQTQLWQAILQHRPETPLPELVHTEASDRRFASAEWKESPIYGYLWQAYLINAEILRKIVDCSQIEDDRSKRKLNFIVRQVIDTLAPSNFAATNPDFIKKALETNGESITLGIKNLITDLANGRITMTDESAFEVGRNLAITPGSVVYENELMQLIQYAPLTDTVAKRPFVIVPPCINKFYILDLQPENSFVRFILEQGHTVFLVSWRNPKEDLRHVTWDDYLELGPLTAFQVAKEICKVDQVNALGFCVGGTITSSSLAVMKARGEDNVASLTLLTTLVDFSDPGDLGCFIDEASVVNREATIGSGGLLPGKELSSVFSALRANELIWQYVVGNYLKGGSPPAFDLLYWNSDSTNLPGPFLAWYLRNMYLENNLRVPEKLKMCGVPVDLKKVNMPIYVLATREDHIVPWKSSYLGRKALGGATKFVLGASGHIAGVINPARKNKRSYWVGDSESQNPEEWLQSATEVSGSWWTHWAQWLAIYTDGKVDARNILGSSQYPQIEAAPGRYVKEKCMTKYPATKKQAEVKR